MLFTKKNLLAAFLEKDNVKLLVFTGSGAKATRIFAGQITFGKEVVRDSFIADPVKFASQIKVAFAQKPPLAEVTDVALFLPPDKTFTKSLPATDSVESFIRSLPYFKEELIIEPSLETLAKGGKQTDENLTYVAFEKKLIEDFERPFQDLGKTVTAVKSSANILSESFPNVGRYFLLIPFDKEIDVVAGQDGTVMEIASFSKDTFVNRFSEFIVNKNFKEIKKVYTLGVFDSQLAEKLKEAANLEIESLAAADIYDLTVRSFLSPKGHGFALPSLSFPQFDRGLPGGNRTLYLVGAVVAGFLLILGLSKGLTKLGAVHLPSFGKSMKMTTPVAKPPPPPPAPEPKPSDYKVRVENGTLVTGEAGNLGDLLKRQGFNVVETKNATTSGFVATRLRTVSSVPQKIIDSLTTTLLASYSAVVKEPLPDTDVQIDIIIGAKK